MRPVKLAPLLATGVFLIALLESAVGLVAPHRIASDADWRAAAAYVRERLADHDLVVFAPRWIDQVGRSQLGDRMPVSMVARADEAGFARIWELSIRGARAEETAGLPVAEERAFGRVTVRRVDRRAASIAYDFTARFADARVTTRPRAGGDEQPCAADGAARRCGGARIEPRVLEIDYRPRRGLLVPAAAGVTHTVAYDDVPGGTLVGYVGLHDYYARKMADGVALFRVRVDETQAVTVPLRNPAREGEGWQRFELALGPGTHRVRFEIESEQPAWRLPGFHAEVRAP